MSFIAPGKRKGNKHWIVRFKSGGRQHEVSTGETNERAARRVAERIVKRFEQEAEAQAAPGGRMKFADAIDRYTEARRPSTNDVRYLERLKADALGDMLLIDVRPADVVAAAHRLYPDCLNETKNRNAIRPAATVQHFAAEQDWCAYRRFKLLPEREPETRRIPPADMERLFAAAEGPMHKLLTVFYYQGWRIGETLGLRREHVDFDQGTLRLFVPKVRKWKTVLMAPQTHVVLATGEWYGEEQRAFPWTSRYQVYREIRKLTKRVGVRFTPHMARHEFASSLGDSGAGTKDLTALGTWTSEQSVLRYMHPGKDHLRALLRGRGAKSKVS